MGRLLRTVSARQVRAARYLSTLPDYAEEDLHHRNDIRFSMNGFALRGPTRGAHDKYAVAQQFESAVVEEEGTEVETSLSELLDIDREGKRVYVRQESDYARAVVVSGPMLSTFIGSLHGNGALFENPYNFEKAQAEHMAFVEKLQENGLVVLSVRDLLAYRCEKNKPEYRLEDRVMLENLAIESMEYHLAKDGRNISTTPEEEAAATHLSDEDRYYLSDEYKRKSISIMGTQQIVDVILTRPTVVLAKSDQNTALTAVNYMLNPLANLLFTRDQIITTLRGVVVGRMNSLQRSQENKLVEFCMRKIGVDVLGNIEGDGLLEGGDFFMNGNRSFIGVGIRTNIEAVEQMMENDWIGTDIVTVVEDLYDRNQARMHLDCVFNILNERTCVLMESACGVDAPRRRMVKEYRRHGKNGEYKLEKEGIEFSEYLDQIGWEIIKISDENQARYGCNLISLGPNKCIMVDEESAKQVLRSGKYNGSIDVVDYSNVYSMYGAVHCSTQVIIRSKNRHTIDNPHYHALCEGGAFPTHETL